MKLPFSRILTYFLATLCFACASPSAVKAEINDIGGTFTQNFRFFLQPGFEAGFGLSPLGSKSEGVRITPKVFTRFKIERGNMFFSPDLGFGTMTGLDYGNLLLLSAGFVVGFREPPPTIGFYAGVSADSFLTSSSITGITARVGFDMDYQASGGQFFTELRLGEYSDNTLGPTVVNSYIGLNIGAQFLIGL